MRKYVIILGLVLGIALFLFAFTNKSNGNCKVKICHVPPGNPANAHTLEVSEQGAAAHLREHCEDYCGPCKCEAD